MRLIRTLIALFFAFAALASAPAGADLYTWNTGGSLSPGSGNSCAGGVACKTTFTSTSGGQVLSARAYSTPVYDSTAPFNVSGNWAEARIALYSGGIGVANLVSGDSSTETGVPNHAMDNRNVKDIVVFELPAGSGTWDPESFKLGWASTDSDVQAWVGGAGLGAGYDFRNVCFSGTACTTLSSLGFADVSAGMPAVSGGTQSPGGASAAGGVNVPTGVAAPFNTTQTGRYLVMSGNLGQAGVSGDNDFFKIGQISARRIQGVPVPGSLVLASLGLILLGFVRTRNPSA